ncbi:hypothetical protein [Entomohabitans teleogrylli]|uniref:hypothetical protein n=1 Tax=Entomohabitans teleogrylli TaxID=1384589 RepID=UPI00073D407C|nr:hypothetical protein [Entomohabitans teleogrylli]
MLRSAALLTLALTAAHSAVAFDDTTPLLWNQPASQAACPVGDEALWVTWSGGEACIRYFSAGKISQADPVLLVFRGDRAYRKDRDPQTIPGNTVSEQRDYASKIARIAGIPVIVVARPGTWGSSGNHLQRRQQAEFMALNAAADGLKVRYGIHHFILSGTSGGATAGAALLALGRKDISCAILASGAYGLVERAQMLRAAHGWPSRPGRDTTGLLNPWDPLDHVDGVAADPQRLIIIVGNEKDQVTPFILQKKFAMALKARGHRVQLETASADPSAYHSLKNNISYRLVADCPSSG